MQSNRGRGGRAKSQQHGKASEGKPQPQEQQSSGGGSRTNVSRYAKDGKKGRNTNHPNVDADASSKENSAADSLGVAKPESRLLAMLNGPQKQAEPAPSSPGKVGKRIPVSALFGNASQAIESKSGGDETKEDAKALQTGASNASGVALLKALQVKGPSKTVPAQASGGSEPAALNQLQEVCTPQRMGLQPGSQITPVPQMQDQPLSNFPSDLQSTLAFGANPSMPPNMTPPSSHMEFLLSQMGNNPPLPTTPQMPMNQPAAAAAGTQAQLENPYMTSLQRFLDGSLDGASMNDAQGNGSLGAGALQFGGGNGGAVMPPFGPGQMHEQTLGRPHVPGMLPMDVGALGALGHPVGSGGMPPAGLGPPPAFPGMRSMDMPGLGMPPGMPPIGDGMHRMASLGDFGTPPPHTLNMPNMAPLGGPFQSPFSALGLSQGLNENTLQNKGGQEDPHTPSLLFGFKQLGIGGHETNPNPSGNAIANGNVNPQRADLFGMYGLNSAYSAEQPMSRLPEFQTPTKLPPQDPLMNFLAQDPFKGSMGPDARASNSSGYVLPGAETTTPSAIKVIDESKLPPAGMPAQTPATTTKSGSQPPMRLVRNQRGTLTINLNNSRMNRKEGKDVDGFSVRPAYQMSVSWMVPSDIFFNKENENLTIALFKYGSMSNTTSVVAKSLGGLSRSTVETKDMTGQAVVRGSVPFHAPKGAGRYVFRLVDQNSDKLKSSITIATSISFVVDLLDVDVTQNFKFSVDAFRDSQIQKGLTQLLLTIPSVRNSGKNYQRDDPRHLANSCIDTLLSSISEGMQILDKARERALQDKLAKATAALNALANENTSGASGLTSTQGDNEQKDDDAAKADKEFFVSVKQTSRLHTDIHDCIGLLKKNQIVFSMLSQNLRQRIESIDKLYCRILNRYFKDAASITIARVEDLNFSPAPRSPLFRTIQEREHVSEEGMQINPATIPGARAMVQALNHSISSVLQHLYPKEDFTSQRTEARARIELILATHGVVPAGTSLLLYGSSCNNFGTDGADMDMCLAFPAGYTVEQDDKALLLERIADALEKGGMRDVRSRATARIPIVNFEDPQSGLECDIGFYNPLALCNTRLLRTYTMADKRLRPLAYVIKHWAKSRKINNPGEGSLGSYGYILCLIHYLQSRAVPVLPNLQRLPPNWSGQFDRNGLPPVYKNESEVILHHLDGTPCKTYFYAPNEGASANPLEVFGSRNQESVGELLAGFFQYFAWEFDYRSNIVSIQAFPDQVLKSQKIEIDAWTKHERLSIEDPFETWYDVAHIIKGAQMAYIRKEFLRAHTLIQRACATSSPLEPGDELPQAVDPAQLLNILCEPGPVPPYSEQVKLARLAKESADAVTESDA